MAVALTFGTDSVQDLVEKAKLTAAKIQIR
jgi:hypothetical protein